jgi:hypothetical protein
MAKTQSKYPPRIILEVKADSNFGGLERRHYRLLHDVFIGKNEKRITHYINYPYNRDLVFKELSPGDRRVIMMVINRAVKIGLVSEQREGSESGTYKSYELLKPYKAPLVDLVGYHKIEYNKGISDRIKALFEKHCIGGHGNKIEKERAYRRQAK